MHIFLDAFDVLRIAFYQLVMCRVDRLEAVVVQGLATKCGLL